MPAEIEYKASVTKDLRRLDRRQALRVLAAIERALRTGERTSEALSGAFSGLYRLRVGEYRAIYARTDRGYLVLRIAHRREACERRMRRQR